MTLNKALLSTLALGATSLSALLIPTEAMALTFNWSFVTDNNSTGGAGQTISGTISGLVEGDNNGPGLTVTVDPTPTGALSGDGWNFTRLLGTGDIAFTVTNGQVTYGNARFTRNESERLYFGGFGQYYPQLIDLSDSDPNWSAFGGSMTYSPVTQTVSPDTPTATPEPSSVLTLLGLGLGLAASKVKKQA